MDGIIFTRTPTNLQQLTSLFYAFFGLFNPLAAFAQLMGVPFEPPKLRPAERLLFIPTEEEIDQLIAGCGKVTSTFLQLLKETAARSGEAWALKWIDVDLKNRTVRITAEKGGQT